MLHGPYTHTRYGSPRDSNINTPDGISMFLYSILKSKVFGNILVDPCIGDGSLVLPWREQFEYIIGVDIRLCEGYSLCDLFRQEDFTQIKWWNPDMLPDMVLCNPPFGRCNGARMLAEEFLRTILRLYGADIPIVLVSPFGFRLNQRKRSKRWRWLRDDSKVKLSSIVSLPVDAFEGVTVHSEILIFNVDGLEPHYFLDDWSLGNG